MFGALGVYCDELFFAIADDGLLFVKVDDVSRADFEEAGSQPFTFTSKDGEVNVVNYWRLPETAYDDPDEAVVWGRRGLEAALRARSGKPARKRKA